jgi:hypothetical protein
MQPEASAVAAEPRPDEEPSLPRPARDRRLVAGFLLANGLVTLAVAGFDLHRDLPPTVGAAPIDVLLALGLVWSLRGAVAATRLRLVAMLAFGTWGALEQGDLAGGLRAAAFALPAFALLSERSWPPLRAALRAALVPAALLLGVDAWVAGADLWFPVGETEFGNRFDGPPIAELVGQAHSYRVALKPGRWRAYRSEYLDRFVSSADGGAVDPATGVDILVFPSDGALVENDPHAFQELIDESLHEPPVDLDVDGVEAIPPGGFDAARVVTVHGEISGAEVQGYIGFFVRDDVTLEVWAVGDPDATAAMSPELREAAGSLVRVAETP